MVFVQQWGELLIVTSGNTNALYGGIHLILTLYGKKNIMEIPGTDLLEIVIWYIKSVDEKNTLAQVLLQIVVEGKPVKTVMIPAKTITKDAVTVIFPQPPPPMPTALPPAT